MCRTRGLDGRAQTPGSMNFPRKSPPIQRPQLGWPLRMRHFDRSQADTARCVAREASMAASRPREAARADAGLRRFRYWVGCPARARIWTDRGAARSSTPLERGHDLLGRRGTQLRGSRRAPRPLAHQLHLRSKILVGGPVPDRPQHSLFTMKNADDVEAQYAAIALEARNLALSIKRVPPAESEPILLALTQFQHKLAIRARCHYCSSLLRVDALSDAAWRVHCSCGKVDSPFRGL